MNGIVPTSTTTSSAQDLTALVGRILLGVFFVMSGYGKISGFDGTVAYIASAGLPMPSVVAALTILIELGGGLMLIVGFATRWAAYVLAAFTLLAGVLFHAYWDADAGQRMGQYINFWKNVTMAGGFLILAAFGPGRLSLEGRHYRAV